MAADILEKLVKKSPPKDLASALSDDEQKQFSQAFLTYVGTQAFGTVPKRELDLFVFHLLSGAKKLRDLANYEWANLLRISEGRVRALRADAALRFVKIDNAAALTEIARQFCTKGRTCMEYDDKQSRIKLLLDNPTLQREFEYAVRNLGRVPDYRFNRSILDIPAATFVAVFVENFPAYKKKFEQVFQKLVKADDEYQQVIDGTKGWNEQFEAICEKHKAKFDLLVELVSVVASSALAA